MQNISMWNCFQEKLCDAAQVALSWLKVCDTTASAENFLRNFTTTLMHVSGELAPEHEKAKIMVVDGSHNKLIIKAPNTDASSAKRGIHRRQIVKRTSMMKRRRSKSPFEVYLLVPSVNSAKMLMRARSTVVLLLARARCRPSTVYNLPPHSPAECVGFPTSFRYCDPVRFSYSPRSVFVSQPVVEIELSSAADSCVNRWWQ